MAILQYKTLFNDYWLDKDVFKALIKKFMMIIKNLITSCVNLQGVYLLKHDKLLLSILTPKSIKWLIPKKKEI